MLNKFVTLKDGTKLYTVYSLGNYEKTIMYIHGGPGNGMWDALPFLEKLSENYNVIAFDERGVNKSDPICEGFSSEMLIDDIEELRQIFSVEKLVIIGHSYGGHLLLRYCIKYHNSVERAIFICPSFNFMDSFRNIISNGCKVLEGKDDTLVKEINELVSKNDFDSTFKALIMLPGDIRSEVYGFNKFPEDINAYMEKNFPSEKELIKSNRHQQAVFSEKEVFDDYTEKLKDMKCPSLLLIGSKDPVCSDYQRNKYEENVINGKIITIENSSHFTYLDSLDEAVRIIED